MMRFQDIWTFVAHKNHDNLEGSPESSPVVHSLRVVGTHFPILAGRYQDEPWFSVVTPENTEHPFSAGVASLIGKRSNNEDTGLVFLGEIPGARTVIPMCFGVVADGMGGHWGGEFASSIAAETLGQQVIDKLIRGNGVDALEGPDEESIRDTLISAMQTAHAMVQQGVPGGGTTATCALVVDDVALIAHVGDCRVYILNDGRLDVVTRDHSYKAALEERGVTDQAASAKRELLYRAIGMNGPLDVDYCIEWLEPNSSLLICCDGVWSTLSEAEMADIIGSSDTPQSAADRLVVACMAAGGRDNCTALVIRAQE